MDAVLALENGAVYRGTAAGAHGIARGEVVFNTSMTGYQEVLTDPSYAGQIVTMTSPQIGNYGVAPEDAESGAPKVAGFIMREDSPVASNWRASGTLRDYLVAHQVVAIRHRYAGADSAPAVRGRHAGRDRTGAGSGRVAGRALSRDGGPTGEGVTPAPSSTGPGMSSMRPAPLLAALGSRPTTSA
jgi:hypothetical protein